MCPKSKKIFRLESSARIRTKFSLSCPAERMFGERRGVLASYTTLLKVLEEVLLYLDDQFCGIKNISTVTTFVPMRK